MSMSTKCKTDHTRRHGQSTRRQVQGTRALAHAQARGRLARARVAYAYTKGFVNIDLLVCVARQTAPKGTLSQGLGTRMQKAFCGSTQAMAPCVSLPLSLVFCSGAGFWGRLRQHLGHRILLGASRTRRVRDVILI